MVDRAVQFGDLEPDLAAVSGASGASAGVGHRNGAPTMESWKAMDAGSFAALLAAHAALQEELKATGEFVDERAGRPERQDRSHKGRRARGVRRTVRGGEGDLRSYYIVEC